METLLTAAINYATLGYPVFPCAVGGSVPITERGYLDATLDLNLIRAWWARTPEANIGLATAGLLVVDIDGKGNAWPANPDHTLDLAACPMSSAPRGGSHHFFRQPLGANLRCTAGTLAEKVDTRADGGYVIVPPSKRLQGPYVRIDGMELDSPREQLPLPPDWLLDALSQKTVNVAATSARDGNPIPNGQRNTTLTRLAGSARRIGHSESEILSLLRTTNNERCRPALDDSEVRAIAESVSGYEPDPIATAISEDWYSQTFGDVPYELTVGNQAVTVGGNGTATASKSTTNSTRPGFSLECLSAFELDNADLTEEFLIDSILVADQNTLIGGASKTLKTSIALDMSISLDSGTPFLHEYKVIRRVRSLFISGESGINTIRETARRICQSKHIKLSEQNVTFSTKLPMLLDPSHRRVLVRECLSREIEVCFIDPAYLALLDHKTAGMAGNVFAMGCALRDFAADLRDHGITPVLLHHITKTAARQNMETGEGPKLEDMSQAGFAEFAGQWLLLGRRTPYLDDTGFHALWLRYGGRNGDGGLVGLDVREGCRTDPGGRRWTVTLRQHSELDDQRRENAEAAEVRKAEAASARIRATVLKNANTILEMLKRRPEGVNKENLFPPCGLNPKSGNAAIEYLLSEGKIEDCEFKSNGRKAYGYRLPQPCPTNPTIPTNCDSVGDVGLDRKPDDSPTDNSPLGEVCLSVGQAESVSRKKTKSKKRPTKSNGSRRSRKTPAAK